ncbi:MAG: DUF4126 domain-containing protein [Bacteroidota bacterium]|nr:DUF4126 domain-containing protein [Bacteroidota bacterium]
MLVLSVAFSSGLINLPEDHVWIKSSPAMIAFAAAAVLEITGYYNPWMDNMLDLITTAPSLFAGILIMYSLIGGLNLFLKLVIVLLLGGGIAVNIQFLNVKARALFSFVVTNGLGNPVFATIELIASLVISLLAVTVPILSLVFLIVIVIIIRRIVKTADRKRKSLIT